MTSVRVTKEAAMGFDRSLTDFMPQALCAGDDEFIALIPEEAEWGRSAKNADRCKAICAACSVTRECMTWALHIQPMAGVWAGVNWGVKKERLAVQRRKEAAA